MFFRTIYQDRTVEGAPLVPGPADKISYSMKHPNKPMKDEALPTIQDPVVVHAPGDSEEEEGTLGAEYY